MAAAQRLHRHLAFYILISSFNTLIIAMDLSVVLENGFHSLDHHILGNEIFVNSNMSNGDESDVLRQEVCQDTYDLCASWAAKDLCDNCTFVLDNCPASCGECTPDTVCTDWDPLCGVWLGLNNGFCSDPLSVGVCEKTCGLGPCAGT
ncbi:unnamed protein product, partial [Meganyctiphanes norvegica]